MRTYIVTIEETDSVYEPAVIFQSVKGIVSITEKKESKFQDLMLPGLPLTDAEMEELTDEMEEDIKDMDNFITLEQLKADLDEHFKNLFPAK
jgi:uncharacterized protein YgfB (UPF0149 family)